MIDLLSMNLFIMILCLTVVIFLYRYYGILINKIINKMKIKKTGLQLMISQVFVIGLNLILLIIFQLNMKELFAFSNQKSGFILVFIGAAFGVIISFLTYKLIKNSNHGDNYQKIVKNSPIYTFLTLLLFVGPAEDILFIGIIQNSLMVHLKWFAMIIYLLVFTFYHFINVLNGAESKKEFLGMLPIRLLISFILSLTFYLTHSLIYGIIIHNLFDTFNYLAIAISVKTRKKLY